MGAMLSRMYPWRSAITASMLNGMGDQSKVRNGIMCDVCIHVNSVTLRCEISCGLNGGVGV